MTPVDAWAKRWNVPAEALRQLQQIGLSTEPSLTADLSEASIQSRLRLDAARLGWRLWRNNSGACTDATGRMIRYGLGNDSAQLNKLIKSSDLIGLRPRVITSDMVGTTIGQFVAREVKRPGWKYTGKDREVAQKQFIDLVNYNGGDARFSTGEL